MGFTVVPRAQIGAPTPPSSRAKMVLERVVLVHYTGAGTYNDPTKDLQYAKSVARFGVVADKPYEYNYLVGLGGGIFEQAGVYMGQHCKDFNADSVGVLMMLSPGVVPTLQMIDAFRWLMADCRKRGMLASNHAIEPHYEYRQTACPGSTLAGPQGVTWNSPTGEGRLGDVIASLKVPWVTPTPEPVTIMEGATTVAQSLWICVDKNDPRRWLWNGFIKRLYGSEALANQAQLTGVGNTLASPVVMAKADFDSIPEL